MATRDLPNLHPLESVLENRKKGNWQDEAGWKVVGSNLGAGKVKVFTTIAEKFH